jgi:hypothetical protein
VLGPDAACDPATFADRCDDASLVYCDGEEQRLDCPKFGFASCSTGQDAGARCL